jgi:signal transduction histidine kinase
LLQSRAGEWWAATAGGLCHYAAVKAAELANRAPEECFEPDATVFQIFEDSKGGIWASAQSPGGNRLMRWDPGKRSIAEFPTALPRDGLVKSFAEDRQGNIWLGLWGIGGLYRYDGQRFALMLASDYSAPATIFSLLTDSRGRLWIGADYGLGLVENPAAEKFQMRRFDQASGLSSNSVRALLEDREGYIYAATGAGVDRFNPRTGNIKHYSAADGVARGEMESAYRDIDGNLWFASAQGLSRLTPAAPRPPVKPSVLITGLEAGGAPVAVSQRGEKSISGIELQPSGNQLQVEFVAFGGEPEANLRYAYKLEGGRVDWSAPQGQHVVNFAALAAGEYHFLVKAVDSDGLESAMPAEVNFIVLPPLWRRWWVEILAATAAISAVYLLYRYRVSQIVHLERMRTAIAIDLHDDIGASLSQIAILSEVARAGVSAENRMPYESLERVGTLAREMVDSLSDIVWSIRAEPEGLDSLARRMREFALDVLATQGIDFAFRTPAAGVHLNLSLHARRQIFLMFKECIHNVSRHAGGTAVKAELKVEDREIALTVEDNGRGLSAEGKRTGIGGNGIPGMRRRAEGLGGVVEIASLPAGGCQVSIRLPLRRVV